MFAPRYFAPRVFAPRYFAQAGAASTPGRLRFAVHAALLADAGISALAGARVYHGAAPETATFGAACVTYQVVSQTRLKALDRPLTLSPARVQVAASGQVLESVEGLAEAVRQLFDGFTGTLGGLITVRECRLENESDLPEPPRDGTGRWAYRTVIDVMIRYVEAVPDRFA